ncbi:sigma-54-dependent Fis family transcriptional regulator [Beijerinckia mobilis]|uniref:sigma-54-dependent Fis family transcriptional regulator n=1 Tax=Beijerinckia mobilis TaxID=231434 RepID=UPI0005586142|nr:sigma-54-dependent Fis family transcriptional regulator [Beijerinckia mobilis]
MGPDEEGRPVSAASHAEHIFAVSCGAASIGPSPVGSSIVASWRRCLEHYKLDPERQSDTRILSRGELRGAREKLDDLLALSDPILSELYGQVGGLGYVVLLTDREGITLNARTQEDVRSYQKWGLWTGSVWSEDFEGTNGVGLCLAEQRPVTVHRGEHFRTRHASLTCTVAPLFGPDGEMIGSLDISAFNPEIDTRIVTFAQNTTTLAAGWIEAAAFRRAYRDCWIVSLGESIAGKALLAFDGDRRLVGASRLARLQLGLDEMTLRQGVEVLQGETGGGQRGGFQRNIASRDRASDEAPLVRAGGRTFLVLGASLPFLPPLVAGGRRRAAARPAPVNSLPLDFLAGEESSLHAAVRRIRAAAAMQMPLLIHGETGSGKEIWARAIHAENAASHHPFIRFDCRMAGGGSQPSDLCDALEAAFEQAACGTLFLDEIAELPLALQSMAVPLLDRWNGAGSSSPVRVISATLQPRAALADPQRFRADLYHRLNGFSFDLPGLRERQDKEAIIDRLCNEIAPGRSLSHEARAALAAYDWPGNWRQLRQVLELAAAGGGASRLERSDFDLPPPPHQEQQNAPPRLDALEATEREIIMRQLVREHFDIVKAAAHLGMSRATLYRRIKQYRLAVPGRPDRS